MATIPRGAKRTGHTGLGIMLVVMTAGAIALTWREQTTPSPGWLLALYGILIAAPKLVAGTLIIRPAR